MNVEKFILAAGVIVSSALYLGCVFAAGLHFGSRPVIFMAGASAGLTYLCYSTQYLEAPPALSMTLYVASVVTGTAAGAWLLFT